MSGVKVAELLKDAIDKAGKQTRIASRSTQMPYIIDGHNLIPKIPGLSLADIDDEQKLIELLLEFCRLRRKQAVVYFDQAPPGGPRARNYGAVTAHFVPESQTADHAIRRHLTRLGGWARNWTVVSSDLAVQAAARAAHAGILSAESFARELVSALDSGEAKVGKQEDVTLSPAEVDEWLGLFGGDKNKGNVKKKTN